MNINKSSWLKFVLFFLIIILTVILLCAWFNVFKNVDEKLKNEAVASWTGHPDVILSPGPPSFWYDGKGALHHQGPIDKELKRELLTLASPRDTANVGAEVKISLQEYTKAIDTLAYNSNKDAGKIISLLLLLGGLSGVLGVQLRSMTNFIGVACYKGTLDVPRWWPWYLIRPAIGFVVGMISVLIIDAGLLSSEGAAPTRTSWWIGVAFLAGFAINEFTDRLRLLSKSLFGESSGERSTGGKPSGQNPPGEKPSGQKPVEEPPGQNPPVEEPSGEEPSD